MLEKIEGMTRVDKLRAILLMEADFNFLLKLIFGSRMMRQVESLNRVLMSYMAVDQVGMPLKWLSTVV